MPHWVNAAGRNRARRGRIPVPPAPRMLDRGAGRTVNVVPIGHLDGNFLSKPSARSYRLFTTSALASSISRQTESATMDFSEVKVSLRAYELWEKEGRPLGRDQAHWFE